MTGARVPGGLGSELLIPGDEYAHLRPQLVPCLPACAVFIHAVLVGWIAVEVRDRKSCLPV